ncbi:MAG: hypothetical protein K2H14_08490 [Muribaculaceae bacterium]|nr:hypothetical protein [Muribaculaceae bacterium]
MDLFRNILRFPAIVMALLTLMCACDFGEDEPELPSEPTEPVGRSVLVYMVANNSLGSSSVPGADERGYDRADLKEMVAGAKSGALGNNRLIVYHHAWLSEPRLIEITAAGERVIKVYDTEDSSVSAARMNCVISDFKATAPADSYGLVLWSHASGWLETGINEDTEGAGRLKSFGVDRSKEMNVTTLARVLDGKGFDYVYFDCCHMAGVEVAYQLRNVTGMMAGSVSELPSPGMPYDRTLPYLMADNADLTGAASTTFAYYNTLKDEFYRTCTISVISMEAIDELADAVGELCDLHPELRAGYEGQRFVKNNCRYYDLLHYLGGLAENGGGDEFEQAYSRCEAAIRKAVVYEAATPYLWEGDITEVKIDTHCGLSTYIKRSADDGDRYGYDRLDWWQDVMSRMWGEYGPEQ